MTTVVSASSDELGTDGRLLLIVEDEPAIADLLALTCTHAGFRVVVARDGEAALERVADDRPALVLLDIGLPGLDGIEVCRALRTRGDWTPVVFVTARDDQVDRIVGLELGADDFVTKPFSPREVLARVRAVLRRAEQTPEAAGTVEVLRHGPLECLLAERRVRLAGREIALTATEFDLLAHLMRSPGRVFSRAQLLRAVWGYDNVAGERTVDVHVAQVRAKLAPHDPFRTVRGVGYAGATS
ncbi:MAG TPA: response regulator transcription factor [Dermatophilaceae bacterium]|nr:response regulator transcription factor [Dermatophilaceae bacterium]